MGTFPPLAKLTAPIPARTFLRSRLFERLDTARGGKVIWIAAPAGAGKTTLLGSYLKESALPAVWYQLDAGDGDVASFFFHLGLAAQRAAPDTTERLPQLTAEYLIGLPAFARNYFRQLFAHIHPAQVVVFDDYHELPQNSLVHSVLREGFAEIPEGVSVVVLSRGEPPVELARLRTLDDFTMLDWSQMRLSLEESAGIARLRLGDHGHNDATVLALHERTQGWVAGLILMIEQWRGSSDPEEACLTATDPLVFDYFAGEVFARTEPRIREFLLKSALLPSMTAASAEKLTGVSGAQDILVDIFRRNYFTYRHQDTERTSVYHYHPLFRQFLLALGERELPKDELRDLKRRAAAILVEEHKLEPSVSLLRDIGEWDFLASLLIEQAPELLREGRYQTLGEWLSLIPRPIADANPWLSYFQGAAGLPFGFPETRERFEKSYRLFEAHGDATGQYLAWTGIIDTYLNSWGDFRSAGVWIAEFEALRRQYPDFPSQEIEARVSVAIFGILMYARLEHRDLPWLASRIEKFVSEGMAPILRFTAASHLSLYYSLWIGNPAKARNLIELLAPDGQARGMSPLTQIVWETARSCAHWMNAENDACVDSANKGLALASSSGVHIADYMLLAQGILGAVSGGDLELAQTWLARIRQIIPAPRFFQAFIYHFLCFTEANFREDREAMLEHATLCLQGAREGATPFWERYALMTMAWAHFARSEDPQGEVYAKQAEAIGTELACPNIRYGLYEARATRAIERGDDAAAVMYLRTLFAVMREHRFVNSTWWRNSAMARLCVKALEHDIEPEYVRYLIQLRGLVPEDPPIHLANWPWPIKVYALGKFEIRVSDTPLVYGGRVQKKPLSLLKALITLGSQAGEARITEALWPEAEGDAAHRALITTLQRLRKLLGIKEAIIYQGGRLTLDSRYCWVDAWAFELHKLPEGDSHELRLAIDLYRGGFLKEDEDAWVFPRRERLRRLFIRTVLELGRRYEEQKRWGDAIDVYEQALNAENAAEEIYQQVMVCYERLGRHDDALAAYHRCRDVFRDLHKELSARTKKLAGE